MSDGILPLCYCTAHDQPHVHLPPMRDSQYGLRIEVGDVPAPVLAQHAESPCCLTLSRAAGLQTDGRGCVIHGQDNKSNEEA